MELPSTTITQCRAAALSTWRLSIRKLRAGGWAAAQWLLNAAEEGELNPSPRPTHLIRACWRCLVSRVPSLPQPSVAAQSLAVLAGLALPAPHVAPQPGCISHIPASSESPAPPLPKPLPVPGPAASSCWLWCQCMAPCNTMGTVPMRMLQAAQPCPRAGFPILDHSRANGSAMPWGCFSASCWELESTHPCTLCPMQPMERFCILHQCFPAPGTASLTSCCLLPGSLWCLTLSKSTVVLPATSPCWQPVCPALGPAQGHMHCPTCPSRHTRSGIPQHKGWPGICKSNHNRGVRHMGSSLLVTVGAREAVGMGCRGTGARESPLHSPQQPLRTAHC